MRSIGITLLLICVGCVQPVQPTVMLAAPSLSGKVAVVDAVVSARQNAQPVLPDDLGTKPGIAPPVAQPMIPLYVYSQRGCATCDRLKRDAVKQDRFRFEFIDDPNRYPKWLTMPLPVVTWSAFGKGYYADYTDMATLGRRYDKTQIKPVAAAPKTTRAYGYPERGAHWTYPGSSRQDLIEHLLDGEHRGKFDRSWLATLSTEQLRSLHDDDHEGRVQWQYAARPVKSYPKPARASIQRQRAVFGFSCPSCPT